MKLFRFLGLIIVTATLLNACVKEVKVKKLSSDLEKIDSSKKSFISRQNRKKTFFGANLVTTAEKHSGKQSVYTDKEHPFALKIDIPVRPDWYFKVSVWRKSVDGKGVIVATCNKPKIFYKILSKVVEKDKNGWEKVEGTFWTSPLDAMKELYVYVWNNGSSDTIYFDDIVVEHLNGEHYPAYDEDYLKTMLDTAAFEKLYRIRRRAFEKGVLQSSDDDWAKGMVFWQNSVKRIKLRLKGDWLDHLEGFKWSFRIKVRKDKTWNRLKTFSVQSPLSRFGAAEWFVHQIYNSEGVLSTRYGFVPFSLNFKNLGLYAWEEHFEKQLIEFHRYREGPVIRFFEDANWDANRYTLKHPEKSVTTPFFDAAVIKPFGMSRILREPVLYREFLIGQNLLYQYKYRLKPASEIFNVEAMAKFYALSDVLMTRHGTIWHNMRFYYNPVLCKLEPIAFDCYTETGFFDWVARPIYGFIKNDAGGSHQDQYLMSRELFNDDDFLKSYTKYLKIYASDDFLKGMTRRFGKQALLYDSLIRMEYPEMKFDTAYLFSNAKTIRQLLPSFEKFVNNRLAKGEKWQNKTNTVNYDTVLEPWFLKNLAFAYVQQKTADSVKLRLVNLFPETLIFLGTGNKPGRITESVSGDIKIKGFRSNRNNHIDITVTNLPQYCFVSIADSETVYRLPVYPWPQPNGKTSPLQELTAKSVFPDTSVVASISGDTVYFKQQHLTLDHKIIIPKGYHVVIPAGTQIDMIRKAAIICYSQMSVEGTETNPVIIKSSDRTANGFALLQAPGRTKMNHVEFHNLNTLSYKGWNLTGAVTFYESDADLNHITITHNSCEDALNIVRSDFVLSNSRFDKTASDAFDSDFSTGLVDRVTFTRIGNDAIDFSGSRIDIRNCVINQAGDKGISAGEDSHLTAENITITEANIGLASKDLSELTVNGGDINHCTYGTVLLQKKPEYGPASMTLNSVRFSAVQTKFLIEKGSQITFNGQLFKGDRKKVAEMFY
jgi:hypothetical protein